MDEAAFETLAARTLEALASAIEDAGGDLEVELQGGVLTIELADGRQFVVNRHAANRQIWLSSPVSGAGHYAPDRATGRWRDTRNGGDLSARLAEELTALTGTSVALP